MELIATKMGDEYKVFIRDKKGSQNFFIKDLPSIIALLKPDVLQLNNGPLLEISYRKTGRLVLHNN